MLCNAVMLRLQSHVNGFHFIKFHPLPTFPTAKNLLTLLNPSHPVHFKKLYSSKNQTFFRGASKGFMKVFKAFIKPSEAPPKKCENQNLS